MDYRNADGSVAEMCGNGVRVYARYLVDAGLAEPGHAARSRTRGGVKEVHVPAERRRQRRHGPGRRRRRRSTSTARPATSVDMGNPHAVVAGRRPSRRSAVLATRPALDLNVEYVEDRRPDRDRACGCTSGAWARRARCGTGACAAVVATVAGTGPPRGTAYDVDVPGGRLTVTWREDGHVRADRPGRAGGRGDGERDVAETD